MKCAFSRFAPVLVLACVAAMGCTPAAPGLSESDKQRSYNPAGKTIVVVLDISGSMGTNDPDRVSVEGTQLIAALVEEGDNIACVSFSTRAQVLAPLRTIKTAEDRRQFCEEISGVKRQGATNFVAALGTARDVLEAASAPAGSTVIFMTDGAHTVGGSQDDVLAQVKVFREKQWKIHSLGYSPEGLSVLLSELASRTGGGYFTALTPKDLLLAYVKVMAELQDVLIAPEIKPVRIWKDTNRLLYVVLKKDSDTKLATVTRDGQSFPFEGGDTFHYPGPGEDSNWFDVLRVKKPAAGIWDGAISGPHEVGLIIQDSPFDFAFAPGAPKREQVDGRPVQVTLLAKGPNEALETLRKSSTVEAVVTELATAEGKTDREVAKTRLLIASLLDAELPFSGEFTPRLKDPKTPETHTVKAHFYFRDGDVTWTTDRTVSYKLVPPPPAMIEVEPAEIDLGTLFTGEVSEEREATVRGAGPVAANVAVEPSAAVIANPRTLPDVSGGAKLRVAAQPEGAGPFRGTVLLRPAAATDDTMVATLRVKANVVFLDAPAGVSLGDVEAGETASAPVKIAGEDPRVDLVPLAGPKGTQVPTKLTADGEKQTLRAEVPPAAPMGDYKGSINVTVGGATKKIPVTLRVTPAQARLRGLPEKLAFSAKTRGWTPEATHETTLDYAEPCSVTMAPTDLAAASGKGKVRAGDQFKIALEGADGGSLAPGRPAQLKAKVYVSADLPPGSYAGKVAVTLKSPDGRSSVKEIPVELTVTR